jgi:hypothetical protein
MDSMRFVSPDGSITDVTFGSDGVMHVKNTVEAQHVTDVAQRARNENGKGFGRNKDEWRHVARLPLLTYVTLAQQGIADDPVAMRRFLNDRDNYAFRCSEGRT